MCAIFQAVEDNAAVREEKSKTVKRTVGIYMRIPMYSVMGGAPVYIGCSPGVYRDRQSSNFFTFLYYGR